MRFTIEMALQVCFYQLWKKKQLVGKITRFNLCQLLLTENVPGNQNLSKMVEVVRKRSRKMARNVGSLFIFLSNFSGKNIPTTLVCGISLSETVQSPKSKKQNKNKTKKQQQQQKQAVYDFIWLRLNRKQKGIVL